MTTDATFWDNIADKYAASPVKDAAAFERKQAITREHLRPDSNVLELGCGTGTLALALAPFAGHIHAIDISVEMLRTARDKQQAQGVSNVTFRSGTWAHRRRSRSSWLESPESVMSCRVTASRSELSRSGVRVSKPLTLQDCLQGGLASEG